MVNMSVAQATTTLVVLGVLLQQAACDQLPTPQGKYLITTPNRFIPGRAEKVCANFFDIEQPALVVLTLTSETYNGTRSQVAQTNLSYTGDGGENCATLTYPKNLSTMMYNLIIKAEGVSGLSFSDSVRVSLLPTYYNPDLTFIQTDKPVYKPGQLVQFRVLTVDTELKPAEEQISTLALETPSKVRVQQWNNIEMEDGLLLFEFQLSDEPELGEYTIKATRRGKEEKATFKVEEYVLPKYEVTLTPPKYITFQSERFEAKVCAKYTFGKPVLGKVEGSVCLKQTAYWRRQEEDRCIQINGDLTDGCYTVNVSDSDLGWDSYTSFQYGVQLELNAEVREQGSGVYLDAKSAKLTFQRYDYKIQIEGPDKYKPGLSYRGLIVAEKLDGMPKAGLEVKVEISSWSSYYRAYSKTYTTDSNGRVKFGLPAIAGDVPNFSLSVKPVRKRDREFFYPSAYKYIKGWYSPSGLYLQVEPKAESLGCPSVQSFKVLYTTNSTRQTAIYYQVVGVGDIVYASDTSINLRAVARIDEPDEETWDVTAKDPCYYRWWRCIPWNYWQVTGDSRSVTAPMATHKGSFSLDVRITPEMSKRGRLLVYYVGPADEVVADELAFDVQLCTNNNVGLTFDRPEARPGDSITLSLTSSPESLCNYGVVDKSVFVQGGENQMSLAGTLQKIQQLAVSSHTGPWVSRARCTGPAKYSYYYYTYYSYDYDDSSEAFKEAGVVVMTNMRLESSPCVQHRVRSRHYYNGNGNGNWRGGRNGNSNGNVNRGGGANGNSNGNANWGGGANGNGNANNNARGSANGNINGNNNGNGGNNFNSNGNGNSANEGGARSENEVTQTLRTYFPETWLFGLATTDGQGVKTLQQTVPDTITEWVGNAVCINPTTGLGVSAPASLVAFQPFFVSMNLPYSLVRTERAPIAVTVFNYQSKCMAVRIGMNSLAGYSVDGSSSEIKCVCSQDSVTSTFTIVMNDIGDVNVSVTAEVINSPSSCPSGSPMSELVGTSDTVIRPVVVKPEGAPREYTVSDFLCMTDPDQNTNSGTVSAEHLLPLPDANMLVDDSERAFVKVVGDVMGPALSNLGNLVRMPYGCAEQTMVSFAPNIFVMKYLEAVSRESSALKKDAVEYMRRGYQRILKSAHHDQSYSSFAPSSPQSSGSMWLTAFVVKCLGLANDFIYIDPKIQQASLDFFREKQDRDGCFPRIGMVHNKYMQGGFGNDRDNKAALTAFVAIAMMETKVDLQDQALRDAFTCINSQTYTDSYTTSIVAYAYSLYNPTSAEATSVYSKLKGQAITENNQKYWKAIPDEPETPVGRCWWYRPHSANTETTAYALLTIVNMENGRSETIGQGLPVARWLSTQRNPWGGFGSTQDTVMGLQALAAYAGLIYDGGISASITVTEKGTSTEVTSFSLNSGNSLVEFTQKIPRVVDLSISASGKGCFLIQTNVRYNINAPDTERQAFITTVEIFNRAGEDQCKAKSMKICTQYVGEGGVSNMAIVEARMVSGWIPDKDSLESLKSDSDVDLKRYEVDRDSTVQFYFDQLGATRVCFSFDVNRKYDVGHVKPSVVTTYDYYKTELRQELEYQVYAIDSVCRTATAAQ